MSAAGAFRMFAVHWRVERMRIGSIALAATLLAGAAHAQAPVASFDSAWSIIRRTHFDTTFNGVDWDAVRTELRPKAEAARNNEELRVVLNDMLRRLKQSHFAIIPKDAADTPASAGGAGDLGFDVRLLNGAVVVTQVEPGSPAQLAGIRTGWILRKVNADSVGTFIDRARRNPSHRQHDAMVARLVQNALTGAPGSMASLEFQNERDRPVKLQVQYRPEPGEPVKFGNLPVFYTRFASREVKTDSARFAVLWFNVWMPRLLVHFDSAVDGMRNADGFVLDLRGNPGGAGFMSTGVAGHFIDTASVFGTMQMRTQKLDFRVNPRRASTAGERVKPFDGPVAILIDELSGSTSEVFAGGMQSLSRMRVFGTTSMGAVLPAAMDRLPSGDVLYHAVADFLTADGTMLEGRGVIPDEQVNTTRADLLAGRDPVLEAALRWLSAQARARKRTEGGPKPAEVVSRRVSALMSTTSEIMQ
jgi:carboxyl-terminal processing protease